jgi:hypothetical protein
VTVLELPYFIFQLSNTGRAGIESAGYQYTDNHAYCESTNSNQPNHSYLPRNLNFSCSQTLRQPSIPYKAIGVSELGGGAAILPGTRSNCD